MKIDTLKHFITVCDAGSFYGAAERLFISPQGLNKEMSNLEAQLDMTLLRRNGRRGLTLTDQGEVFLDHAKAIVREYDAMIDDLMASASNAEDFQRGSGHIEIVTTFHVLHVMLLGRRSAMLPTSVKLTEREFMDIVKQADRGEPGKLYLVDMYATGKAFLKNYPSLYLEEFYQTTMGLAWKDGMVKPLPNVVSREEICDLPMVTSNYKGTRVWLDYIFRDHPLTNVVSRGTMPAYLFRMAQEGLYAMCDSDGFHLALQNPGSVTEGLRFSMLDTPEASAHIGLLHKQGVAESPMAKTYGEALRRILSRDL
ncbi:MAG: LysR family transcriptional regulator [Eggerthellaceae bacterium]|nr:LysR family transcriptional regulator [Eggerthellaceae bacterium]